MTKRDKSIILWGAISGMIVCTGDFAVLLVFGAYYPGYSQQYSTMSSLGASVSPVSGMVSGAWIVLGVLCVFFGYSFWKAFVPATRYTFLAAWLLVIYGLGEFVGSGVFKADHIGNTVTNSAVVHGILGTIGLTALAILPLVMLKIIPRRSHPRFYALSWMVFVVGIVLAILFNSRFFHAHENQLDRLEGLWQRLLVLNYYIYLFAIILKMLKIRKTQTNFCVYE